MEGSFFKAKTDFGDPNLKESYKKMCNWCAWCKTTIALFDVHHIINAKANKKIETYANYLMLCRSCHIEIHKLNWHEMVKKGLEIKYGT